MCPSGLSSVAVRSWSFSSTGRRLCLSSASPPVSVSTASTYAFRKPAKVIVRPEAAKVHSSPDVALPTMRTDIVVPLASVICEAIVRCQIIS